MTTPCPYGTHRVLEPKGSLPQAAARLDASLPIRANEILIEVDTLNIDSASFHQMKTAGDGSLGSIAKQIMDTVASRGKQHNPVTGSGGMLLGTVTQIGCDWPNSQKLIPGDRIATLVSLSLTPLHLHEIESVIPERDQVKVKGHAILFATANLAKIPDDLPQSLSLAVLDVAGAPAQMYRLVKPCQNVVIVGGGGKSGILCSVAARSILKNSGRLIAIEPSPKGRERLESLKVCDQIIDADATDALCIRSLVAEATNGELADLVVNVANVENTEMSCILAAKNQGTVYYFSMATSFTRVALGAEGVSSDATLLIGNGYALDNAAIALNLVRSHHGLRELFISLYS